MLNGKIKAQGEPIPACRIPRTPSKWTLAFGLVLMSSAAPSVQADYYPAATFPGDKANNGSGGWGIYYHSGTQGRTRWSDEASQNPDHKQNPELRTENGVSFRRFKLYAYSPYDPAGTHRFLGAEIRTNKSYGYTGIDPNVPAGQARTFTAKVRLANVASGAIAAFYPYGGAGDEIDFEYLGTLLPSHLWLNVHNDGGQLNEGAQWPVSKTWTAWHNYRIKWSPGTVEWFIDDYKTAVRRVDSPDPVPDEKLQVHLNIWAPDNKGQDAFGTAYDGDLQPAATETAALVSYFDVAGVSTGIEPKAKGKATSKRRY